MRISPEDLLFEYLRDIIFEDDAGKLNVDDLPLNLRDLGEGLALLSRWMKEAKAYSLDLSGGNLHAAVPPGDNKLVDPLKELQSTMKHITWQAEQITKGDYGQHLDFMGEFSNAFNKMTSQLKERTTALEKSNYNLLKSRNLFMSITESMNSYVIILDENTGEVKYANKAARELKETAPQRNEVILSQTKEHLRVTVPNEAAFCFRLDIKDTEQNKDLHYYYKADISHIVWDDLDSEIFIIQDISEEKHAQEEIEKLAFIDALTGLHNRHYIMEIMDKWLDEKKDFCVAFIDLDNLKHTNDVFGHEEGDRYILQTTNLLAKIEGQKELARVGGDEFLFLIEKITENELTRIFENKRKELQSMGIHEEHGYQKTFSFGIIHVTEDNREHRSYLLRQADTKMYAYKMSHKPKIESNHFKSGTQLEFSSQNTR